MLKMRSLMGETQAVVTVAEKTAYRRYAPDSVKFSDAKTSSLADVGIGDQLRARGVKSEDGLKVTADEVVFGTFVTKAGKIASVDVAAKQIKVLESGTNKPLLINIAEDSQIKKMPNFPAMGGGMPGRSMPGPMPGGTGAPMGGMRAPDMSQMLERMPSSKLEDLKTGETIVVSSTKGQQPAKSRRSRCSPTPICCSRWPRCRTPLDERSRAQPGVWARWAARAAE